MPVTTVRWFRKSEGTRDYVIYSLNLIIKDLSICPLSAYTDSTPRVLVLSKFEAKKMASFTGKAFLGNLTVNKPGKVILFLSALHRMYNYPFALLLIIFCCIWNVFCDLLQWERTLAIFWNHFVHIQLFRNSELMWRYWCTCESQVKFVEMFFVFDNRCNFALREPMGVKHFRYILKVSMKFWWAYILCCYVAITLLFLNQAQSNWS